MTRPCIPVTFYFRPNGNTSQSNIYNITEDDAKFFNENSIDVSMEDGVNGTHILYAGSKRKCKETGKPLGDLIHLASADQSCEDALSQLRVLSEADLKLAESELLTPVLKPTGYFPMFVDSRNVSTTQRKILSNLNLLSQFFARSKHNTIYTPSKQLLSIENIPLSDFCDYYDTISNVSSSSPDQAKLDIVKYMHEFCVEHSAMDPLFQ